MNKEPKFSAPWYSMEGKEELQRMEDKNLMHFCIHIGNLLIQAWEYEKHRVKEPLAVNVPKPYIEYLPDRYLLAPEVYWMAREELKARGLY